MCRSLLSSVIAVFASSIAFAQTTPDRPNIILIMADDMGYECLSANGSADYETPRLDALAAEGMRFTHCYSQPLCTPSRVQIMTGRYNFRNYTAFGVLPPEEITFGHVLKDAGYATAIAGKWQLYGFDTRQAQSGGKGTLPEAAGFDDYCLWQVTHPRKEGERYADPLMSRKEGTTTIKDGYGPDVSCDFILSFIESHQKEPFFVYYPMALPHDPFVPTPDSPEWSDDRHAKNPKHFADMVEYTDKIVGRIVDQLDRLGLRENTVLMFTGDNGSHRSITSRMQDGRTIKGDKGQPTDGGTHVPFVVSWPGTAPQGLVADQLIDFSDFLPTLAELAGAELPSTEIDGLSFAPQLRGQTAKEREWVFCYYDPQWGGRAPARFARDQQFKLFGDGRFLDMTMGGNEGTSLSESEMTPEATSARTTLQAVLDRYPELPVRP